MTNTVTGCSRSNDGAGTTSAEIVYDVEMENQFCITDDFTNPHVDGRAFSNMGAYIGILCARMGQ